MPTQCPLIYLLYARARICLFPTILFAGRLRAVMKRYSRSDVQCEKLHLSLCISLTYSYLCMPQDVEGDEMNNLNVVPMPASSVWLVWDEVENYRT